MGPLRQCVRKQRTPRSKHYVLFSVHLISHRTHRDIPTGIGLPQQLPRARIQCLEETLTPTGDTIIKFLPCGNESDFANGASLKDRPVDDPRLQNAEEVSEGMLHQTLAKMIVLATWPKYATQDADGLLACRQHAEFYVLQDKQNASQPNVPNQEAIAFFTPDPQTGTVPLGALLNKVLETQPGETPFPVDRPLCASTIEKASSTADGLVKMDYRLTRECLHRQVNLYLLRAYPNGQNGSSGLPCFPFPLKAKTEGE